MRFLPGVREIAAALETVLTPKVERLEGEMKAIDTKIDSVRNEMVSMRNELKSDITRVEKTLGSDIARVEKTLGERIDSMSNKLDLAKDVEKLKVEVATLKQSKS